jgi:hypothetical protein
MAYDEALATRVRKALARKSGLTEKKMFGGLAFLLNGNMCCGILGDGLMVRLDPERAASALREPNTSVFDMTGRPMKGWIVVDAGGLAADDALKRWVDAGADYAATLPSK